MTYKFTFTKRKLPTSSFEVEFEVNSLLRSADGRVCFKVVREMGGSADVVRRAKSIKKHGESWGTGLDVRMDLHIFVASNFTEVFNHEHAAEPT